MATPAYASTPTSKVCCVRENMSNMMAVLAQLNMCCFAGFQVVHSMPNTTSLEAAAGACFNGGVKLSFEALLQMKLYRTAVAWFAKSSGQKPHVYVVGSRAIYNRGTTCPSGYLCHATDTVPLCSLQSVTVKRGAPLHDRTPSTVTCKVTLLSTCGTCMSASYSLSIVASWYQCFFTTSGSTSGKCCRMLLETP